MILAVGACSPPAPPPNPFASSGGATDPSLPGCGSCFVVDRDNPVFRATDFKLRGGESVTRGSQGVSYTNFLIEPVLSLGNPALGADSHPYLALFAQPEKLVTFFPGDAYPFEIRGLEAGYAPLGVFANYRDVNNGGFGMSTWTRTAQLVPSVSVCKFPDGAPDFVSDEPMWGPNSSRVIGHFATYVGVHQGSTEFGQTDMANALPIVGVRCAF